MELRSDNRRNRSSPLSRSLSSSFLQFYAKYRELILFNKNIIVAAVASIIVDAIVVQYAAQITSNNIVVSIISMIIDTVIYLATFVGKFLIDNNKKCIDSATGEKNSARFRNEVEKIITALGISELVYMIVKFTSVYMLLQSHLAPPYQVTIVSVKRDCGQLRRGY